MSAWLFDDKPTCLCFDSRRFVQPFRNPDSPWILSAFHGKLSHTLRFGCVLLPPHLPLHGVATPLARGSGKSANESTVARQLVPC